MHFIARRTFSFWLTYDASVLRSPRIVFESLMFLFHKKLYVPIYFIRERFFAPQILIFCRKRCVHAVYGKLTKANSSSSGKSKLILLILGKLLSIFHRMHGQNNNFANQFLLTLTIVPLIRTHWNTCSSFTKT